MLGRLALLFSAFAIWLVAAPVQAMSVTPIVFHMKSFGSESSATIVATNTGSNPMPVSLTIFDIQLDEDGATTASVPAEDDFLVLPPQAIIPPGSQQTFRFQFIGDPELPRGRLFRFNVDEVPVRQEDDGQMRAQLNIVYSVAGLITLAPINGTVLSSIEETALFIDEEGKPRASIKIRNDGSQHMYLSKGSLSLRQRDVAGRAVWSENLSSTRIEREIGFGIIPPGQSRVIILPYELPTTEGTLAAEFEPGSQ